MFPVMIIAFYGFISFLFIFICDMYCGTRFRIKMMIILWHHKLTKYSVLASNLFSTRLHNNNNNYYY